MKTLKILAPALAALALAGGATPGAAEQPLKLERVVMLMRHGVRPPTKADVTPPGMSAQPWSAWTTPFGELTPHGAEGARLMGKYDRGLYAGRGLVAASGCPAAGEVSVVASGKSRAIDTAKNFAAGMFPGCDVPVAYPATEKDDTVFHPSDAGAGGIDGDRAKSATEAQLPAGGLKAVQQAHAKDFAVLARVLGCGGAACNLLDQPTEITAHPGDNADLSGALGIASTAGQTVLLEYLEGKPMDQVGWGRASKADIGSLLNFHTTKFFYETRTPYVAERYAAPVARRVLSALEGGPGTGKLTVLVGHDTNIAALGGLLDLHWTVGDYPTDDPPPGGALGFELLSDASGTKFVRAFYQAQTMDQLRNLTPLTVEAPPAFVYIPITGCTSDAAQACPLARFQQIVQAKLDHPAP
ncbi:MAG: histidine-type phosphatase [Pseudomonadota bacterium]|uniref:histidine-type phosphatase n=1 Tax=unclassified Phenylobacterium TaxID=2640670 RepID=UPI0006F72D13|nr:MULTISPECIES: histidine-type phosphatase [unclassified Phenylobacterium]KRB52889.1 histidine acid phosphatase [Phenylobacterium sp. Root700]MBT9471059.1 histidine-type phosphatase [Phenylobacterium sp.]